MTAPLYIALTAREADVLQRYIRGELYKEIAVALKISLATVMEHRDRIVLKTLINGCRLNMRQVGWLRGVAFGFPVTINGTAIKPRNLRAPGPP